jgi:hypothetical protein
LSSLAAALALTPLLVEAEVRAVCWLVQGTLLRLVLLSQLLLALAAQSLQIMLALLAVILFLEILLLLEGALAETMALQQAERAEQEVLAVEVVFHNLLGKVRAVLALLDREIVAGLAQ